MVNPSVAKNARGKDGQNNGRPFDLDTSSETSDDDGDFLTKMSIITRPTVVTFPRFTAQIV